MKRVVELLANALRGRNGGAVDIGPACCVPRCAEPPVMILAATDSHAIRACSTHARQWVASRECRFAAANAGPGIVTILRRWAAALGPDLGPRSDYPGSGSSARSHRGPYLLRQTPANR